MKGKKSRISSLLFIAAAALSVAACSTTPPVNQKYVDAEDAFQSMQNIPGVEQAAGGQVTEARTSFDRARAAWQGGADKEQVDYLADLAQSKAETASAVAKRRLLQDQIDTSGAERSRLLIASKEREAIKADAQRRNTERANASLKAEAAAAKQVAARANLRARALADQMRELKARETDRGMVITLDGVLFESGSATLKSGATRKIERVAELLNAEQAARALIEGFTDSSGSERANLELSQRRAESVRQSLIRQGIAPNRISTRGLGEAFPVASNDDAVGRQQNRRVEIVLSEKQSDMTRRR